MNAMAQNNLGAMYFNGHGVSQNYKLAFMWYTAAAEQGYAVAQYNLGGMYRRGKNYEQAVKWYAAAAEQEVESAQFNLGLMYSEGIGVIQEYKKAVKWYTAAALQGSAIKSRRNV